MISQYARRGTFMMLLLLISGLISADEMSPKLIGTLSGQHPVAIFSIATEQGGTREVILQAGDTLGRCVVNAILPEEAALTCNGQKTKELLSSGEKESGASISQWKTILLEAEELKGWIKNGQQIVNDIDLFPHVDSGTLTAYEIQRVRRGSVAERYGLRKGDRINAFNHIPVSELETVLAAVKAMQDNNHYFTLSVRRGDKDYQLTYLLY
ncbi:MAG TPA: hypothetical protein DCZ12_08985 [Gammaproteobacteria bacterium]|nr:hypothetical protein [Gammaproteobacteria bacterium]